MAAGDTDPFFEDRESSEWQASLLHPADDIHTSAWNLSNTAFIMSDIHPAIKFSACSRRVSISVLRILL